MSRVAWFNCSAGTAGDMTMAALIDAGADQVRVGEMLAALPVHDYALTFERTQRCGVGCTRALVAVHEHDHEHHRARTRGAGRILRRVRDQGPVRPRRPDRHGRWWGRPDRCDGCDRACGWDGCDRRFVSEDNRVVSV